MITTPQDNKRCRRFLQTEKYVTSLSDGTSLNDLFDQIKSLTDGPALPNAQHCAKSEQ